jgi:hypothetical protein
MTQAPWPITIPIVGETRFDVNVTLTDWKSGQSALFTLHGDAETGPGPGGLASAIGGFTLNPQSRRLGNNLYSVWMGEGVSTLDSTAPISAPIEVDVTPVATPEPGTLALALGGLSLVAFRVRRLARGSTN